MEFEIRFLGLVTCSLFSGRAETWLIRRSLLGWRTVAHSRWRLPHEAGSALKTVERMKSKKSVFNCVYDLKVHVHGGTGNQMGNALGYYPLSVVWERPSASPDLQAQFLEEKQTRMLHCRCRLRVLGSSKSRKHEYALDCTCIYTCTFVHAYTVHVHGSVYRVSLARDWSGMYIQILNAFRKVLSLILNRERGSFHWRTVKRLGYLRLDRIRWITEKNAIKMYSKLHEQST